MKTGAAEAACGEMPEWEWGGLLSRGCGVEPHGGSIPSLFTMGRWFAGAIPALQQRNDCHKPGCVRPERRQCVNAM